MFKNTLQFLNLENTESIENLQKILSKKEAQFRLFSSVLRQNSGIFRAYFVASKFRAFLGKISCPKFLKSSSEFLVKFRANSEISDNLAALSKNKTAICGEKTEMQSYHSRKITSISKVSVKSATYWPIP